MTDADQPSVAEDTSGPSCDSTRATQGSLRFLRQQHIRCSADFQRAYDSGERAGDALLLVFARRNTHGFTRIGLSVSRKHGGAVQRNLRKRRIREAFRLVQNKLPPGLDMVLIPRHGPVSSVTELQSSLVRLAGKLDRRLPKLCLDDAVEGK